MKVEQGFENALTERGARITGSRELDGGLQHVELQLILIDSRVLSRECLAHRLAAQSLGMRVREFGSVDEWRKLKGFTVPVSAVLLNIGGRRATDEDVASEIACIVHEFSPAPVVVLADSDELALILKSLESGARGYIPSSTCFDICVEALHLAVAGGVFIPASSILSMRKSVETAPAAPSLVTRSFTPREEEVIKALRMGKANKIIAHELRMQEGTAKIHVRNIMKKLEAKNRTEAVYKLSQMPA